MYSAQQKIAHRAVRTRMKNRRRGSYRLNTNSKTYRACLAGSKKIRLSAIARKAVRNRKKKGRRRK